jgi:two-component system, chemotaxis family, chemotaxis protein CheY
MARKLLIADDAVIIREMIKETVLEAGWDIAGEATNGQEAIDKYNEVQPDAVTLDLVMPEYDGLHALAGILKEHPDAKVLVVSALDQKCVLQEAIQLGAHDFIVKPFDRKQVIDALNKMVATTGPVGAAT